MDFDVSAVPQRELGMHPYEIMTSESQERMLAIVTPDNLEQVTAISKKWEIRSSVVGKVTEGGLLRIMDGLNGTVLGEVPAISLHEDAPLYERPLAPPDDLELFQEDTAEQLPKPKDIGEDLVNLLSDLEWVTSQYDSQLFLNAVVGPGGDAAVLRLKDPISGRETGRGLAVTTDGNHRWCAINPRLGTAMSVAEAVLNLACVGAEPRALVNCLNFGNPENPTVMWQLSEAVDGMSEACREFDLPVVGGNVSLYNESQGTNIDPTPIVGVIGVIDNLDAPPPGQKWSEGDRLIVIGPEPEGLSGSAWAFEQGHRKGILRELNYDIHKKICEITRELVQKKLVTAVHDVSVGGIGVATAEMAIASGVGCSLARISSHEALFSESSSRVVLAINPDELTNVEEILTAAEVPKARIGLAHGDRFTIKGLLDLELQSMKNKWKSHLPTAFEGGTTQG